MNRPIKYKSVTFASIALTTLWLNMLGTYRQKFSVSLRVCLGLYSSVLKNYFCCCVPFYMSLWGANCFQWNHSLRIQKAICVMVEWFGAFLGMQNSNFCACGAAIYAPSAQPPCLHTHRSVPDQTASGTDLTASGTDLYIRSRSVDPL